jgi:hypothetical protein
MVEVVEDGQGLLPAFPGRAGVAGGAVGVAEVDEHAGFLIGVAELAVEGEGLPVAGDRVGMVAEGVAGVPEAIRWFAARRRWAAG